MELLYELNSNSYNTVVYKIQTAIPNKAFKIKIDFSRNSADNKVYLFENYQWITLIEDNFKVTVPPNTTTTTSTTSGFTNNTNSMNTIGNSMNSYQQRDERVKFYLECIYKLLCM